MPTYVRRYHLSCIWIIVSFAFALRVQAQQMVFCERTDPQGNAIHPGTSFSMDRMGSFVQVLIKPARPLKGSIAIIDLFMVNSKGQEVFENTRKVDVQSGWTWFAQQFTFYKAGEYVVYAYDEDGTLLATSRLKLKIQSPR